MKNGAWTQTRTRNYKKQSKKLQLKHKWFQENLNLPSWKALAIIKKNDNTFSRKQKLFIAVFFWLFGESNWKIIKREKISQVLQNFPPQFLSSFFLEKKILNIEWKDIF